MDWCKSRRKQKHQPTYRLLELTSKFENEIVQLVSIIGLNNVIWSQ